MLDHRFKQSALSLAVLVLALPANTVVVAQPVSKVETAATAEAPVGEPEYPAKEILAAFATACSGIENIAVAKASLAAAGWEQLADDADTPVTRLVQIGKAMLQPPSDEDDASQTIPALDGGEYQLNVAGQTIYAAISGVRMHGILSQGCRVYDFNATAMIDPEILTGWAQREPDESRDLADGIVKHIWEPGLKPGHMDMDISFVPQNWPYADKIPLSGLIFQVQSVEFIE